MKSKQVGSRQRTGRRASASQAEPALRRWTEQRWLLDNTIRAVGVDWDQPRSLNYNAACGPQANADFAAIRQRVQKYADISPAFEAAARRREQVAEEARRAGQRVTARDNFFMAAVHWAASQWPFDRNDAQNLRHNGRKRACYSAYARLADHRVEAAWVKLPDGRALPGWFHLPHGYSGGRVPAIVSIPGMDGFKEANVALYGDRWLARGIAVLVIEGPGQYEAAVNGIYVSMPAWQATGTAAIEWLRTRKEIDPRRIGIVGNSFGSFFATIACAHEPRFRAISVASICLEPGGHTIFQEASPTFKRRFMYMSGYTDEAAFDEFRKTLIWQGHAERIRVPYLCVAGERDELCPLIWADRLMAALRGPKRLVVYQESRHAVGNVSSTNLGPNPPILAADWMAERLAGKRLSSERWFVESSGRVVKTRL